LERRADIFFAAYLPEILSDRFGRIPFALIPEFPIHIPTIYPGKQGNLSYRIDYLAVFGDPLELIFIELKTDPESNRNDQDRYLLKAKAVGMAGLLRGLRSIYAATTSASKYDQVLSALASAGLITIEGPGKFVPVEGLPEPQIVYLQPHKNAKADVITFNQVADVISTFGDILSIRFAESIRRWAQTKAGGPEDVS